MPITQEILRVSGALCQELGTETNLIFIINHNTTRIFGIQAWSQKGVKGSEAGSREKDKNRSYTKLKVRMTLSLSAATFSSCGS